MRPTNPAPVLGLALLLAACGQAANVPELGAIDYSPHGEFEDEPLDEGSGALSQGLVTCGSRHDTGYDAGRAYSIEVVTADGKPCELRTADAYAVMQDAAARSGVHLRVISGFRTNAEQTYLYACYTHCNCNGCSLAARPGWSNHQSGEALDLNTREGGVYAWLAGNASRFGFRRTVPSEPWHWEYGGGGPGGGPCGSGASGPATGADGCTDDQRRGCGNFGCACVGGMCSGGFCDGSGCTAQETANCAAFGAACVDHACNGGFAPGSGCTARETRNCAAFGADCADHHCSGGFADGTGCTAKETNDCAAFGTACVDHHCSGGFGEGSGCTPKESLSCANVGCGCADHACGGGFCPGSGCTAKQASDCAAFGCGCNAGSCAGGYCR